MQNITTKKILIADDDPISLRVLSEYLQIAGYNFVAVEDGQQAWELLQQTPEQFVLVISDRIMPKLHGLELLANMRQYPVLKNIPFVMLTGVSDKAEVVEATKAGVDDFLYKPITKELLLAVVKRMLNR